MRAGSLDHHLRGQTRVPGRQRLADIGFVLVASPDYLLSHGTPLHPRDLAHHNCITYQSRERRYHEWSFRQGKERQTVQVAGNYRVDLAEAVRDAALAGLGIAYVPTTCWTRSCNLVSSSLCCPSGNRTRRWRCTPSMPGESIWIPRSASSSTSSRRASGPGPTGRSDSHPGSGKLSGTEE